ARNLSVRETENLVRRLQSTATKSDKTLNPDLLNLQEDLSRQLKLRVAIHCNAKGKGKLVIHYRSLAELDSLLSQFQD
ncbi:MAG: chromosome partitioning protein ParB, partial [Gammaproteobacteria bacterium]|nr:chromosome partitioning protein ParB [Gammaproteobacteria bacterium]